MTAAYSMTPVKVRPRTPILVARWNTPSPIDGKAGFAVDCDDHPAVKPTSYMELAESLGTSGCSAESPYWIWSVMGVLHTDKGKLFVSPGDYVVWFGGKSYLVLPEAQYLEMFEDII